jgi:hypothetical protein
VTLWRKATGAGIREGNSILCKGFAFSGEVAIGGDKQESKRDRTEKYN